MMIVTSKQGRELGLVGKPPATATNITSPKLECSTELRKGGLLIAHPLLVQSTFTRSIVLLVQARQHRFW